MSGAPPYRPSASNRTAPSGWPGSAPAGSCSPRKAAEELGVSAGDRIALGRTEREVAAVAADASYSHTPVVWTTLDDWQRIGHEGTGPADRATVIALTTTGGVDLADEAAGTSTLPLDDSLTAIGSYRAENGSLQLMRGFLFAISALVIGAFFTVWTIPAQR
ncbi:ABC transporter substrate-binding protein [Streptomyces badius]